MMWDLSYSVMTWVLRVVEIRFRSSIQEWNNISRVIRHHMWSNRHVYIFIFSRWLTTSKFMQFSFQTILTYEKFPKLFYSNLAWVCVINWKGIVISDWKFTDWYHQWLKSQQTNIKKSSSSQLITLKHTVDNLYTW